MAIHPGKDGFWGPVTATLDWCEENYIVSPYLAEMWNSTSNLFFLLLPLIGIYSCIKTQSERRYWLSYFALMLVGLGSFMFHGTLVWSMQLLDEVPMLMGTCVFVYTHLQMFSSSTSPTKIVLLTTVLIASVTSYLLTESPLLFQATFIVLTLFQLASGLYNLRRISRTHHAESKSLAKMIIVCVGSMLLAFALWNTDQIHCGAIQEHRRNIGYPLRIGLELHAWWHLLTCYGGYMAVVCSQYCRLLALGRRDVQLAWIAGVVPRITKMKLRAKTA
ncbi:ceramidase [Gaertneriomyces semiglobifer]|nr:ceramidase [Gaertneriomyces semiglobifer]